MSPDMHSRKQMQTGQRGQGRPARRARAKYGYGQPANHQDPLTRMLLSLHAGPVDMQDQVFFILLRLWLRPASTTQQKLSVNGMNTGV